MIIVNSNITIEDALKLESEHYDLFRQVFGRVGDLYARSVKDLDSRKSAFEAVAKEERIKDIVRLKAEFLLELENQKPDQLCKEYLVYFYALNTIDLAYKYCCSLDMGETNSLSKLMLTHAKKTYLGKSYLLDMLDSLSTMEDITSSHLTGEVARHFVEKAIKKEREPRSDGGKIRAKKYKQDREEAFKHIEELWDSGNWKKCTDCAADIHNLEGIKLPYNTVYNYLRDYKKSKN